MFDYQRDQGKSLFLAGEMLDGLIDIFHPRTYVTLTLHFCWLSQVFINAMFGRVIQLSHINTIHIKFDHHN